MAESSGRIGKYEIRRQIGEGATSCVYLAYDPFTRRDVAVKQLHPQMLRDSDASAGHPRKFGTFPTVYADYVVKEPLLTLPQFIHRSSGLAADTFGFAERGYLREGYHADVVVFDPAAYAPRSTYAEPTLPAAGVGYVLVNGKVAYENGAVTGALAGSVLRHVPTAGAC